MSYYGEGTMCRRADVLRHEANELAACMVALAELMAGAIEVHRPATSDGARAACDVVRPAAAP